MSEWVENRMDLPGGGSVWSRGRQAMLPGGLHWIEQEVRYRGAQAGPFAMGAGWIIEFIELKRGRFALLRDGRELPVSWRRFVWVLPAFSVVHMDARDAELRFVAVAGENRPERMPAAARPAGSRIFPLQGALPANAEQLLARLESLAEGVSVEITTELPLLVRRAKRRIEQSYRERASIAALAKALGVSHAHLTREFRRGLGMSPLKYLHHLRSSEALARLSSGESIIETSLDVGYNDLSRFYKQFQRLGCSPPGRYKAR